MVRMACFYGLCAGWVVTASWTQEFVQRYEAQGLAILNDLEADWSRRADEYGLQRPTQAAWRIIPVSKWLITMVSKSPK